MKKPIIIGANLTGLSTALALSSLNCSSILVDKRNLSIPCKKDGRAIALSYGSKQILEEIAVWKELSPYAGPINEIRVTEQYSPLFLHFDNNDTLGHLVESDNIQKVMYSIASKDPNITILDNTTYELIDNDHDQAIVKINEEEYITPLLIAADGKFSNLRKLCNIKHFSHDYNQKAIVCKVQHEKSHNNIAQEIFLPHGPFAILPLRNQNQSGIVWTETHQTADALMDMKKDKFNYFLREKFTDYLGKVELIGETISYPLILILAERYYHNRVMLIGDSAHSVHPIAGQGFNLAMRDIESLIKLYSKYENLGLDFGCYQSLEEYQSLRMKDNISMAAITDGLNKLFSNDNSSISMLRKIGLSAVNQIPPLKKFFMEYAMAKKQNYKN